MYAKGPFSLTPLSLTLVMDALSLTWGISRLGLWSDQEFSLHINVREMQAIIHLVLFSFYKSKDALCKFSWTTLLLCSTWTGRECQDRLPLPKRLVDIASKMLLYSMLHTSKVFRTMWQIISTEQLAGIANGPKWRLQSLWKAKERSVHCDTEQKMLPVRF